ncbi:hypothetical protein QG37_07570 [Candidozyma auris]|uniref:Uncharacterized protein n=1 Tax=Candidozyma auris TaxID=498019 RepID=A0A0L0NQZ1_CANAR|nr:hypothetical protein QG37_07570 [[Candida] auris]
MAFHKLCTIWMVDVDLLRYTNALGNFATKLAGTAKQKELNRK